MKFTPDQIDLYSYYDYKAAFRNGLNQSSFPSWVPEAELRRLGAYVLLESYMTNNSRIFLDDMPEEESDKRREYGDPAVIVDTILSSLIGDSQQVYVEGSTPDEATGVADATAMVQQTLLEDWMTKENFLLKMIHTERKAIKMGDGVYVLGWDDLKGRPRLRTFDAGFYFPYLDEDSDNEFPNEVRIAYDIEREVESGETKTFMRCLVWRMVDIEGLGETPSKLPWQEEGEAPATQICYYWDGEVDVENIKDANDLFDIDDSLFDWDLEAVNTGLDFIPVIHMPNTIPGDEHYGTSSLAKVLQIIDDVVATDSDLQAAAATTGSPPLVMHGAGSGQISTYGPGTVLSAEGGATLIDTSKSLDALLNLLKQLLSRTSVNSRIPESLLGRIKPSEVPSGITLTLSFTPHSQMIKEMRLLRDQKYKLLLKFVLRMYRLYDESVGVPAVAHLVFGSFLPADKNDAANLVSTLYRTDKPIISLETAINTLVQAGMAIEDATEEVNRIVTNDFRSANELLDATGDVNASRDRLGLGGLAGGVEEVPLPELPAPNTPESEL